MPIHSQNLRVLVCTANLGNARPDEASIEALIPDDGSINMVVDNQRFPIPSQEEQLELMSEIGFNTIVRRTGTQSETATSSTAAPTSMMKDTSESTGIMEQYFDIIVLGLQEATFDVDANDPTILAVHPTLRKALGSKPETKTTAAGTATGTPMKNNSNRSNRSWDYTSRTLDTVGEWREANDSKLLGAMLHQRCPSYNFLVRFQRGEMRLEILTRKDLEVDLLSLSAQNTGIGVNGIMNAANKGGIVAELLVDKSTRLSFCTTHLQAHEGREKYEDRCRMTSAILEGTAPEGPVNIDLALRSHFTFFLGDLNFRTELPDAANLTKEEHHQKVMALVEDEDWRQLNMADELFKALRDKDCLVGFKTLPCFFPPTFKVERCEGIKYKDQRRPSYTDRILWKAMHKLDDRIKPVAYEPVIDFTTSDHKPVRGAFKIRLNDRIQPRHPQERRRMSMSTKQLFVRSTRRLGGAHDSKLHLFVSNIKCGFRKRAMAPDPIVVFMSFPYALTQQKVNKLSVLTGRFRTALETESAGSGKKKKKNRKDGSGFPRTRKLKATYSPEWLEEVDFVIATHDKDGKPFDLTGSVMFVVVIDKAPTIEDKVIGVLPLNLAHLAMSTSEHVRQRRKVSTGRWNSLRDIFSGSVEMEVPPPSTEANDADNRILHMKQPLTKYGKKTGWISLTVDSKWLLDNEVAAEKAQRGSVLRVQRSFRTSVQGIFGRGVTMVEATEELPNTSAHNDLLEISQRSRTENGVARIQRTPPRSPAISVSTWH